MRVGVIALQHESNTFSGTPTTFDDFEKGALLTGPALRERFGNSFHEVGGFFAGLDEAGIEAVPVFLAWALPGGVVTARTLEKLLSGLSTALLAAGHLDGLLVAPHGAGVAENAPDMDGAWLRELRSRVGPQMPIVGTLDLHANLTEAMVRATNALIAYRTNPHIDQRKRGIEAARLMAKILGRTVRPTQAASYPPLAINIERQGTSASPCREAYEALGDLMADKRVLSASLLLGFPYADVREMGTSVLVVTDDDPDLARRLADDFAEYLRLRRNAFVGQLTPVREAVAQAANKPGPVCVLDMGDNIGGGSSGDGTLLLKALIEQGVGSAFVAICDPAAAERALKAGINARLELQFGGKSDPKQGGPIVAPVSVRGLYDGKFEETQARHGGQTSYDMGPTAVVQLQSGQTVMLTSRRVAPFSLQQMISCNLDPASFQVIVAKGVHAPIAAYSPVCKEFIRADTAGCTTAAMTTLSFSNRRKPLFPFEEI